MSKTRIIALLGVAILLGAILSNPSEEKIKEELIHQAKVILKKQLDEENQDVVAFGMAIFGDQVAQEFLSTYTYTQNYYVFSQTKMNVNGQELVIATGIFNQIWVNPNLEEKGGQILKALKDR
ncbi:MAG TPA: hypothetical protein H9825_00230 [Candidatus Sphingobacterium stercorigallinarum]|nr:hypothetical protein [Candidatus Sphingobacterium stercorigallinarum]